MNTFVAPLSAADIIGIITAVGVVINSIPAFGAWRTGTRNEQRLRDVANVSTDNANKIEAVHIATNSMKDALVAATRASALVEGKEHEQDMQRQRDAQVAALTTVLADPTATAGDKATATTAAAKPI